MVVLLVEVELASVSESTGSCGSGDGLIQSYCVRVRSRFTVVGRSIGITAIPMFSIRFEASWRFLFVIFL